MYVGRVYCFVVLRGWLGCSSPHVTCSWLVTLQLNFGLEFRTLDPFESFSTAVPRARAKHRARVGRGPEKQAAC